MFVSKQSTFGKAQMVQIEINSCLHALSIISATSEDEKTAKAEVADCLGSAKEKVTDYLTKYQIETSERHTVTEAALDWHHLDNMLDDLEGCFENKYGYQYPAEFYGLLIEISDLAEDCREEIEDLV